MPLNQLLDLALTPDQERLAWLAGSVLLYVSTTNIAWLVRPKSRPAVLDLLISVVRFAFYVGIPYVALLGGVVTPGSLGLIAAPEREAPYRGALAAAGTVVLMALIWWYYRRQTISWDAANLPPRWVLGRSWGWVLLLVIVLYQQIHWAFYRALPFLILEDRYIGGFLGLGVALLEAYANPRVRHDLDNPAQAEFLLGSAGFAVITTVLFVSTGTSWLGAGAHLVAATGWLLLLP